MTFPRFNAAVIAYQKGFILLRRVAVSYGFEPEAAIAEAVSLSQTTTLTFTQAVDEVIRRMGERWQAVVRP